jgi:hypothetical protein
MPLGALARAALDDSWSIAAPHILGMRDRFEVGRVTASSVAA